MIYLQLFWEFFKTGLFAIGGGLATLPFLRDKMCIRDSKALVSDAPRCGLDPLARRLRADVDALDRQRHAQPFAQRAAERLVPVGLRAAQAVVEVKGAHRIPEREQRTQQRNRIRAARQRRQHRFTRVQHMVVLDGLLYRFQHGLSPHECGPGWRTWCTGRPIAAQPYLLRRGGFSR